MEARLLPFPRVVPLTNGYLLVSKPIRHYFFAFSQNLHWARPNASSAKNAEPELEPDLLK